MKTKRYLIVFWALLLLVPMSANALILEIEAREGTELQTDDSDGLNIFNRFDCEEDIEVTFVITVENSETANGSLYFYRGDCKNDNENFDLSQANCEKVEPEMLDFVSPYKAKINLKKVVGDICTNPNLNTNLWAFVLAGEGHVNDGDLASNVQTMVYDHAGPTTFPTGVTTTIGSEGMVVGWTKIENDDVKGFLIVAWDGTSMDIGGDDDDDDTGGDADTDTDTDTDTDSDITDGGTYSPRQGDTDDTGGGGDECPDPGPVEGEPFSFENITRYKLVEGGDKTSGRIDNLDTGKSYLFAVASLDEKNNPSFLSEVICQTPLPTVDFFDELCGAGGGGCKGKFCFIATAAFGSYDHPVVKVLRNFRDDFLEKMPLGAKVIESYYSVGPALAATLQGHETARLVVVKALTLFAGLTLVLTWMGPLNVGLGFGGSALIGLLMGLFFPMRRRRR